VVSGSDGEIVEGLWLADAIVDPGIAISGKIRQDKVTRVSRPQRWTVEI
jgi:hypothetical protein